MKYPSEIYLRSDRNYQGLQPIKYPLNDREIEVTSCVSDSKTLVGYLEIIFAGFAKPSTKSLVLALCDANKL